MISKIPDTYLDNLQTAPGSHLCFGNCNLAHYFLDTMQSCNSPSDSIHGTGENTLNTRLNLIGLPVRAAFEAAYNRRVFLLFGKSHHGTERRDWQFSQFKQASR